MAAATAWATFVLFLQSPLSVNLAAWYFGTGAAVAVGIFAVAGYCCFTAIGDRRLFAAELFGDP